MVNGSSFMMNGSGLVMGSNSLVVHGGGNVVRSLVVSGNFSLVMDWGGGMVDGSVMNLSSLMYRSSDVVGLFVMNGDRVMGVLHMLGWGVCWHFMVGNMSLLNSVRAR